MKHDSRRKRHNRNLDLKIDLQITYFAYSVGRYIQGYMYMCIHGYCHDMYHGHMDQVYSL